MLSPTGLLMTLYPASASEVAASGRQAGEMFGKLNEAGSLNADSRIAAYDYLMLKLGAALGQGRTYDYQREGNRFIGFHQHPQFRSISNFNVGLFCQQAGLSLDETLSISGNFASIASANKSSDDKYHLEKPTREFIEKGWQAGASGAYGTAGPNP